MSDLSANIHFSDCMHRNITVVTTGNRRFIQGEVTDNIEEHIQCMDCLEYLTEAEVRVAWDSNSPAGEISEIE